MHMPFNQNIFALAKANTFFRKEVATGPHSQIVIMCIPSGGEIGAETHTVDQTLVFVAGAGEAELNGEKSPVSEGSLVLVAAGTKHNFTNTGREALKLFTVYAPPEHAPGTIHKTKAEADADDEHYPS